MPALLMTMLASDAVLARRLDILMIGDVEEQRLKSGLGEVLGPADPGVHLAGAVGQQGAGERQADSAACAGHQGD
jgi:hypothetical protein